MKRKQSPTPVKALRTLARTTGTGQITSVETARVLVRRYKVMNMRKDGYSYAEIAETLSCSPATVREDVREILGKMATLMYEDTEEGRNLEVTRMDALLKRYQPLAEQGNLAAAGLVLQISAMRRKLLSLDVPEIKATSETAIRIYVGVDVDAV